MSTGCQSMTGFGCGSAQAKGVRVRAEISSVNRRQLDVRIGLPRDWSALEARVAVLVRAHVRRGSVSGNVRIERVSERESRNVAVTVDRAAAREAVRELRKAAAALGLGGELDVGVLLSLPGVVCCSSALADGQAAWPLVKRALAAALKELCAMRKREGRALSMDLARRMAELDALAKRIAKRAPATVRRQGLALRKRIREAGVNGAVHADALTREIALLADRSDVQEECVRIGSHLSQGRGLLRCAKPVGRTLDFLCQELLREANTIGSKVNDAKTAALVIRFKNVLECLREQAQNIE